MRRLFLLALSLLQAAVGGNASPTHDQAKEAQTVTITAAPSIPSTAPQFVSERSFTSAILNSTNFFRAAHNATPVVYNATLARFAAGYLADNRDCAFDHSGGPYGENLAIGCSDAQGCVDAWGNEGREYDFDDPGFDHDTGHFTQLVWKHTTDVGCGRKLCGESGWFLVCEYYPRGNVIGQFDEEVQRAVNAGGRAAALPFRRSVMLLVFVSISLAL